MSELIIDLSKYQGQRIDFAAVAACGVRAAICKATEGGAYVDQDFAANVAGVRAAGLLVGAYHFGHGAEPEVQAQHFLAAAQAAGVGFLVLDWETNDMPAWSAASFVHYVHSTTRRWPMLYGGLAFLQAQAPKIGPASPLLNCALWEAAYRDTAPPPPPEWAGRGWTFWQSSDKGKIDGIPGDVDVSLFNGDLAELQALWAGQ